MTENLYEIFSSFPQSEHVERLCKPGQGKDSCRYLTLGGKGYGCAQTSNLKDSIDKKVENGEKIASGINCEGLLGLILSRRDKLKGKKVKHQETMPTFKVEGTLQEIKKDNGKFLLIADWKDEGREKAFYNLDSLNIEVESNRIIFGIAGLRTFAGETSIFF